MIRIGLIIPDPADATSWYRALGPLGHLLRTYPYEFCLNPLDHPLSWASFYNIDVLFMQRPHKQEALDWMAYAQDMGIPVWLDTDDALWGHPPEHPSFHDFRRTEHIVKQMYGAAEMVSVSTPALALELHAFTGRSPARTTIIPNAINERFCPPAPSRDTYDPRKLVWRGGPTHQQDVELVKEHFMRPDVTMHYYGAVPHFARKGDHISGWLKSNLFQRKLAEAKGDVLCVPLKNTLLSRCRSNCSWLEATWAGLAVAHATDHPDGALEEFQKPGVIAMDQLDGMDSETLRHCRETSLSYIEENLTLRRVNHQRADLLRSLA